MIAVILAVLFCAACLWGMSRVARENMKWYVPYVSLCFALWLVWFLVY